MRIVLLGVFLAIGVPVWADADIQLRQLEKELARIQQESQSTYQQFLMIQELRRNEMSEVSAVTTQPVAPEKSVPIPNYQDFVQQRREKQERIKQYAVELDSLYDHYKALEAEKYVVLEQMKALGQKAGE